MLLMLATCHMFNFFLPTLTILTILPPAGPDTSKPVTLNTSSIPQYARQRAVLLSDIFNCLVPVSYMDTVFVITLFYLFTHCGLLRDILNNSEYMLLKF
jgi:hypothetical protein